jgi:hypothetical protein
MTNAVVWVDHKVLERVTRFLGTTQSRVAEEGEADGSG